MPLILVLVFTLVAYSNTLHADYQFDDLRVILNDGFIKNIENFYQISTWEMVNLRPLALFSFAINYQIHGITIFGYHAVNIAIHLLSSIVFFLLLNTILKRLGIQWSPHIKMIPIAIFALHPIQTQAVTYIVQRMTSLSVLFYLASLLFYIKSRLSIENSNKNVATFISYGILCISFAVASILSKQIGISIFLSFAFIEFFILHSAKKNQNRYIGIIYIVAIIAGIIYATKNELLPHPARSINRIDYFLSQLHALPLYFKLIFTGIGQNIDHHITTTQSMDSLVMIGASIYAVLVIFIVKSPDKLVKFSACFFIGSMLVESSVLPIKDILVEHRMYLPLIPISILAGHLINTMTVPTFHKQSTSFVLMLIFTALTFTRNANWQTRETLWEASVKENEDNPRALNNLGQALMDKEEYNLATEHLLKALTIKSNNLFAQVNLAISYSYLNEFEKAAFYAERCTKKYPRSTSAWYALGIYHSKKNNIHQAKQAFSSSLKFDNRNYDARKKLAEIAISEGNIAESVKEIKILKQLNPDYFVIEQKSYLY